MTNLRIVPSPADGLAIDMLYVSIRAQEIAEPGCRSIGDAKRIATLLTIQSQYGGVKKRVRVRYSADVEGASLCVDALCPVAQQSRREGEIQLATGQTYWRAETKRLGQRLCWLPSATHPDFNLTIEVSVTAFSNGIEREIMQQFDSEGILHLNITSM